MATSRLTGVKARIGDLTIGDERPAWDAPAVLDAPPALDHEAASNDTARANDAARANDPEWLAQPLRPIAHWVLMPTTGGRARLEMVWEVPDPMPLSSSG